MTRGWNHNVEYHRIVIDAVPPGARTALDAGCGDGLLTRDLRAVVPFVVGMDLDGPSLGLGDGPRVRADVHRPPFRSGTFDVVASIAMLHHLDARTGLARLRELVAPGGVLVVVGLARSRSPLDLLTDAAAVLPNAIRREVPVAGPTCWPPPTTFGEIRIIAGDVLPGVRYRRHLYFRYSLVWHSR